MTDLSNLAADLEAANRTARWVQQQLAKASMDSDGVALEALIAQRDDAERDAKRVLAERNAVIAERDALALKLEATTRELECRTTERDAAIAERDEAHAFASSLHAERARLRTYAARPSSSDDGVAPLAADPCADAFGEGLTENTVQTSARDLEPAVSSRAAASPESAGPEVVSRLKTVSESLDLEDRVAALEAAVSYASKTRGVMDARLAALEAASARADAKRMLETELPHAFVDEPTDWGVDMR